MARKKQKRFAQIETFSNTLFRDEVGPGGSWVKAHFGNSNPLILELGCGKGEYTLALAEYFPEKNVIGIDRKGERVWKGAARALEEELENVAFLRMRIEEIDACFDSDQIDEIWMPFPDPLPKRRQAKHRILSEKFVPVYRRLLRPEGLLHVKTDDEGFFDYAAELLLSHGGSLIQVNRDLYRDEEPDALLHVQTTFERRHLNEGKRILYLRCRF